ncbi:hypothetical protein ACVIGA_000626 [Bradyrhizobium sp. USDA 3240]
MINGSLELVLARAKQLLLSESGDFVNEISAMPEFALLSPAEQSAVVQLPVHEIAGFLATADARRMASRKAAQN